MSGRPSVSLVVTALACVWALAATILLVLRWPQAPVEPPAARVEKEADTEPDSAEPQVLYQRARFSDLPGWEQDAVTEALPALVESCRRLLPMPAGTVLSAEVGGVSGDWQGFCGRLTALGVPDDRTLRAFLESELVPVEVIDPEGEGLFTGYYEPTLSGRRQQTDRHRWPLYRRPPELVELDLGAFREHLEGETILGHVRGDTFMPYHRRDEIDAGNLAGRELELAWVDDPVDAFFLHIQGSGRVEMAGGPDQGGSVMRVGYDGQNGHAYTAIGRELVRRGAMPLEEVSMQSIRAWLEANPAERQAVLHTNPSYIFFRELEGPGPIGSLGAPLTPRRSVAVDRSVVPLGAPVWVATTAPTVDGGEQSLERLLSAQDTGGAIRGAQRGDVFWGPGEEAAEIAGRMKHPGRMWLLHPRPPGDE